MKIGGASLEEDLRRIDAVLEGGWRRAQPRRRCQWPRRPAGRDQLMQRRSRRTICSGTRRPAIRSTIRLQAKPRGTLFAADGDRRENVLLGDAAATCCAVGAFARIVTICSSTVRCRKEWSSICVNSSNRTEPAGRRGEWCRTVAIKCRSIVAAGLHLGGNESYPDVFRPFGGFADGIAVEEGYVGFAPACRTINFAAKSVAACGVKRSLIDDGGSESLGGVDRCRRICRRRLARGKNAATNRGLLNQIHMQVLIGVALGAALGLLFPEFAASLKPRAGRLHRA